MFVGFSPEHSSLVPLVLNLTTGKISPQYHVIFDDKFQTVPSLHRDYSTINDLFANMFDLSTSAAPGESCRDFYLDPVTTDDGLAHLPPLASKWSPLPNPFISPTSVPPQNSEGAVALAPEGAPSKSPSTAPEGDPEGASEGALTSPPFNEFTADSGIQFGESDGDVLNDDDAHRYPQRTNRRPPARYRAFTVLPLAAYLASWAEAPGAFVNNAHLPTDFHPTSRLTRGSLADNSLVSSSWTDVATAFSVGIAGCGLTLPWLDNDAAPFSPTLARVNSLIAPDLSPCDSPTDFTVEFIAPHALSAKARGNPEDNPDYDTAMWGPYRAEYTEACRVELSTLLDDLDCWEYVPFEAGMNVLPSTWAFKCKRYPDGRVKKFKARFCARGDKQIEGVDYFETWSPVAQWTTVRLMMVLSSILDLKSAQADITAAFVHAELPPEEQVFIQQPRGFPVYGTNGEKLVLRLKRSLYGLKQAPRHFFRYLKDHLEANNVMQSQFDPCLFIGNDIIVVVYVDDMLLYAKDDSTIDNLIKALHDSKIWIRKEGSAEGFLGVDITRHKDGLTLTQAGLTKRIITALGLDTSYTTKKDTPAEVSPLPKDANGEPADPAINYPSVVGMLLYLCGHTRPDIAFAVHQCSRYTFKPTRRHVCAVKRIGRYLKGTQDKGLIMRPSRHLRVDCYPDADFAGLYSHEDSQDPHCVRSRTGYVICLSTCPVLWKSKLQTKIALSTMEAEYVALSQSCKDLFPLLDQIYELADAVGLPIDKTTSLHVKVHEDNVGALTLGKLEPRRMTPRCKHYAIKYHWFREHLGPRNIELVKIATEDQLGDILTKGLTAVPFCRLRSRLMGW
jgi:hypothetical protein